MSGHGAADPMAALVEHGMLLQSARGPVPSVVEIVVGAPVRGSWWGHARSHDIFDALNALDESRDVVRLRLINGKVTLVHRRLWPALARVADQLPSRALAAIREEHTPSGAHRAHEEPFPSWVPADVLLAAKKLSSDEAWALLPLFLRPAG